MTFINRLEKYCLTPAMSGFEDKMIAALSEDLTPYVDSLRVDTLGNVIAKINGTESGSDLMIFAHTDSLGMIVKDITEDGFLKVERVGGVPERILPAMKVLIQNNIGEMISGNIGFISHHLTPADEKYRVRTINDSYIDIGATSPTDVANSGIKIGSPVVYKPSFDHLLNNRISATSLDDRGGCALLVEVAKYFKENPPKVTLHIVGAVQEEFNLRGAMVAAQQIQPTAAISIDLVAASDTPDISQGNAVRVGAGPVVGTYTFHGRGTLNGLIPHPKMVALAEECAQNQNIAIQRHATMGLLTDASYVQLVGNGVACVDLAWPTRYTHSGAELSSLDDLVALGNLLIAMVEAFPVSDNFSRSQG